MRCKGGRRAATYSSRNSCGNLLHRDLNISLAVDGKEIIKMLDNGKIMEEIQGFIRQETTQKLDSMATRLSR